MTNNKNDKKKEKENDTLLNKKNVEQKWQQKFFRNLILQNDLS